MVKGTTKGGANGNVKGVNGGVGGAPEFSTIIAKQLQNLLPAMLAQENVGNVIVNGSRVSCSYKEFLACNPKEYDGKGGAVVLTHWIEKMKVESQIRTLSREVAVSMSWNDFKFIMIQEFCPSHEMQKLESELWNHAMVGAGHAAYTDRFHKLARLVPHLISGSLTDEAVRNGLIKKVEKRGNVGEPSKDRNGRDDNKKTRTVNVFATTMNHVGRENMGNLARDCRGVPMNVNPINARNPTVRACYECGSTDHWNQGYQVGVGIHVGARKIARIRTLCQVRYFEQSFCTTLFDSGATIVCFPLPSLPLLGLEPSKLGSIMTIERDNGLS
ncbi:reverse transcriptase domain-containing protein [Tanacetum coccineum]